MVNLDLGDITVRSIEEISGPRYRPDFLLPGIGEDVVRRNAGWMASDLYDPERDLLAMIRQTFVVRTKRHTVLIDTCVGNAKPRNVPAFNMLHSPWEENFRRLGLSCDEVDHVLFTHLHVDHVGWNTRLVDGHWVPTFPNATYFFARAEFDYWATEYGGGRDSPDGPVFADSVAPVVEAGQAMIVNENAELLDGFRFEPAYGHSIGHCAVHLECADMELIFCGDVMHHPIQVREPDLSSRFCEDQDAARATRRRFLESVADRDAIVIPAHFERGSAGRVTSAADGFHFEFLSGQSTRN